MASPPQLYDGDPFTLAEVEGKAPEYPFIDAQIKDTTTKLYRHVYEIERSAYTPAAALATDPDDSNAYIIEETPPAPIGGDWIRFARAYANVPIDQIRTARRFFNRPKLNDLYSQGSLSGFWVVSFDELTTDQLSRSWGFHSRQPVTRFATQAGATIASALPGTNITFVEGAHTLNLAANSSAAATVTAFNATLTGLTGVAANASTGFLSVVWSGTMASITVPTGVLLSYGSYFANFFSTGTSTTPSVTAVAAVAHGASVGDFAAFWIGNKLAGTALVIAVQDADNFSVLAADISSASSLINYCGISRNAVCFANGTRECAHKVTGRFYLPGVTSGISSVNDIPATPLYADPAAWLGRLLASTWSGTTATASTDKLTTAGAHGMTTGDTFWIISLGTGAAGLAILTQYWAIVTSSTEFKVASTPDNAKAGTSVNITSDSTGLALQIPAPYAAVAISDTGAWKGAILMKETDEVRMAEALEIRDPTT